MALDRQSVRGDSLYLHDSLQEGNVITISNFAATFPLAEKADSHVLIAGGIGITDLLSRLENCRKCSKTIIFTMWSDRGEGGL